MQQWDYRLGINGVKRMQAAYNTALVAQGAFSGYWTRDVQTVGGWPDAIGEDIVLTWSMLGSLGLVQYEPSALAFTAVPEKLGRLSPSARAGRRHVRRAAPQPALPAAARAREARLRCRLPRTLPRYRRHFFWVPGVILFLFGYPLIVGWWSMLLIPITLAIFGFLARWQARNVFRTLDIHPASDRRGFLGYLLAYQPLTSAAALRGYWQYLIAQPGAGNERREDHHEHGLSLRRQSLGDQVRLEQLTLVGRGRSLLAMTSSPQGTLIAEAARRRRTQRRHAPAAPEGSSRRLRPCDHSGRRCCG